MENVQNSGLTSGRGCVYSLQYHLVWCTKYRKRILTGAIEADAKEMLWSCAAQIGCSISEMEVMPDHVHMLLVCSPQFSIPAAVKTFKGNTARRIFSKHPELKLQLWGGHLWNPSYCIVTVSDRSEQQIRDYIRKQKQKR